MHPDRSERDFLIYESLVERTSDFIVAFDDEGLIQFANQGGKALLGFDPEHFIGRSVLEFIHPDDHARALQTLAITVEFGSPPGTTEFELRHADGSWVHVETTGGHATDDGERVLFSASSRPVDDRYAMSEPLLRLLRGSPLVEVMRPACDTVAWKANGSEVGISWRDVDGLTASVSTGVDLSLVGERLPFDEVTPAPWSTVWETGTGITGLDLHDLDADRQTMAGARGLGAYWIEPVGDPAEPVALVTVWTRAGSRPPINHAFGMETAKTVVEVILRWAEQQRLLDFAAYHDPLTGVGNRKKFFEALDRSPAGGAVLYLDLDYFKAVNDLHGHGAGDELLRLTARRIESCVRAGDVVARLGGDEFAVLCPGASPARADEIASRIEKALDEPFELDGRRAHIGVSIGVGHALGRVGPETLEVADRNLYRVKAQRRPPRGSER